MGLDPQRARHHQPLLIHPQAFDCRPACWGQTLHTSRVLYPHEVILPVLRAWVK